MAPSLSTFWNSEEDESSSYVQVENDRPEINVKVILVKPDNTIRSLRIPVNWSTLDNDDDDDSSPSSCPNSFLAHVPLLALAAYLNVSPEQAAAKQAEFHVTLFWTDTTGAKAVPLKTVQDEVKVVQRLRAAAVTTTTTTSKNDDDNNNNNQGAIECRLYANIQAVRSTTTHNSTTSLSSSSLSLQSVVPSSPFVWRLAATTCVLLLITCILVLVTCIYLLVVPNGVNPTAVAWQKNKPSVDAALLEQSYQELRQQILQQVEQEQNTLPPVCSFTARRRCFTTHAELRNAVVEYSRDPTNTNSNVAQMYGWPIGTWCVSHIDNFSRIFKYSTLNEPLDGWDVSKARTMERMFYGARNFNQDLTTWNVHKVRNFRETFAGATAFSGQGLEQWNVTKARDMYAMMDQAVSFQGNEVSKWNVARVHNMHAMFRGAVTFDGDLSAWNTAKVTDMARMFRGAAAFTGKSGLGRWCVSKVKRMDFMFEGATSFNDASLQHWDVSAVKNLRGMFLDAHAFVQNLCAWGKKLPHKADAKRMFEHAVSCPARPQELVVAGPLPSPLCFKCD